MRVADLKTHRGRNEIYWLPLHYSSWLGVWQIMNAVSRKSFAWNFLFTVICLKARWEWTNLPNIAKSVVWNCILELVSRNAVVMSKRVYPQIIFTCDSCPVELDGSSCNDCALYKPLTLWMRFKKCMVYGALWICGITVIAVWRVKGWLSGTLLTNTTSLRW